MDQLEVFHCKNKIEVKSPNDLNGKESIGNVQFKSHFM